LIQRNASKAFENLLYREWCWYCIDVE